MEPNKSCTKRSRPKGRNPSRRMGQRGFTLFELIVAISLFSVLAAVAIPHMHDLSDAINRRNAELQVLHDIRYAQAATVEQGCRGVLKIDANGRGYQFGCDYVPYHPSDAPNWDRVLKIQSLPTGISVSSDATIFFNSRGQVIDSYGVLTQRSLSLTADGGIYSRGILRPTGFFEYLR